MRRLNQISDKTVAVGFKEQMKYKHKEKDIPPVGSEEGKRSLPHIPQAATPVTMAAKAARAVSQTRFSKKVREVLLMKRPYFSLAMIFYKNQILKYLLWNW